LNKQGLLFYKISLIFDRKYGLKIMVMANRYYGPVLMREKISDRFVTWNLSDAIMR